MEDYKLTKPTILSQTSKFHALWMSMILIHNHPSGSLTPSEADKAITDKIKNAANLMDIKLLDHLILTDCGFYSFADEGRL